MKEDTLTVIRFSARDVGGQVVFAFTVLNDGSLVFRQELAITPDEAEGLAKQLNEQARKARLQ